MIKLKLNHNSFLRLCHPFRVMVKLESLFYYNTINPSGLCFLRQTRRVESIITIGKQLANVNPERVTE